MKHRIITLLLCLAAGYTFAQQAKLESFPHSSVKLLQSPFYQAQQTDMQYILDMDPDRLLAPFVIEAGMKPKAERYGNWESGGLDGHIGGHYLSALSLMYAANGNQEMLDRLNYMIDVLEEAQERNGNGYLGGIPGGQEMWQEIKNGNINAGGFSLNDKWVPLYNIHKLYAGLRDAYLIARNEKAKEMLIDLTDWMIDITSGLSDEQMQDMLRSEHGGLNEVFADVADITGENKYLELAKRFSHRVILEPLTHDEDKLTGLHANTQIPKVIGYERVAELDNDEEWAEASEFFWETVVNDRSVSIGGNSVREHFHPVDDFSSMMESNQGPETCNTYNMLRLTKMLFLRDPESKYMDYYERALYNHILSSQHPEGGLVYFTPMRPRHYRVYSQPETSFWCCVGSGIENHGKYNEMIYAHDEQNVFVNLFIPSKLKWEDQGITLTQKTKFPYEEKTEIKLDLNKSSKFSLFVRKPVWVENDDFEVLVNGKSFEVQPNASSYVEINRKWKNGDVVSVALPMETKAEYLPDHSPWVSFVHGPIVLAGVTDSTNLDGIWADDSRMGHVAGGEMYPIDEAPLIVAEDTSNVSSAIKPVDESSLIFTASSAVYPQEFKDVPLVPFFEVHEARYMVYWPVVDQEGLETRLETIREREKEMLALEAITVDQVATGEQQPETEHNFKGEKTESGIHQGKFWRHAFDWFSYDLTNENKEGKILRVNYSRGDAGRTFDIFINDQKLTTVNLKGDSDQYFYHIDYKIPEGILNKMEDEQMTVKFVAQEGSIAGGVYYVRLLKE